jgi:hypothetical protein
LFILVCTFTACLMHSQFYLPLFRAVIKLAVHSMLLYLAVIQGVGHVSISKTDEGNLEIVNMWVVIMNCLMPWLNLWMYVYKF